EGKLIGGLELKWRTISPPGVIVKTEQKGKWVEVLRDGPKYATQYITLPEGLSTVRITAQKGKLELCEIAVLTQGDAPRHIQVWRDAPEKVDMMLFSTHPDDEVLWFGGLLPYYAGELKKDVLVINAVYAHYYRRQELLAALWTCGVDVYPVMLGYPNQQDSMEEIIREWEVKNRQPKDRMVALIRQYKPDVVVLHDVDGEYGHTAHITFSWLGRQGVERAADAAEHPASAAEWGVWDVPKTYIHLYAENQLRMDWHQPLSAFGGRTGLDIAAEGFACHATQQERWKVEDGGEWDNALFGLWRTNVGPDVQKNDLFENIPVQ
ncbi:MAG: PIG-L family deacetylase, partial [Clostridia bacterium]|nr:PIG-L family deacetylase [Clostridia bacterium]